MKSLEVLSVPTEKKIRPHKTVNIDSDHQRVFEQISKNQKVTHQPRTAFEFSVKRTFLRRILKELDAFSCDSGVPIVTSSGLSQHLEWDIAPEFLGYNMKILTCLKKMYGVQKKHIFICLAM